MKTRTEQDTMGTVLVPADKYWGAQTQRSLDNFKIGTGRMPIEIIKAFAILKKAAALTNVELGVLSQEKCNYICRVCDEIYEGQLDDHFPLGFKGGLSSVILLFVPNALRPGTLSRI